jgi:hypothetical protein
LGQLQGQHFLRLGNPLAPPQQLIGSLSQTFDPQPYMWGQKVDLHLTPNFEVGVSATAIFSGYGRPLTLQTFVHTFGTQYGNAQALDPGKRTGGFDISYRLPQLRDWMTLYVSGMTWDEINPIAYPRRSSFNPGIYMPKLPMVPKLDLRVEGVYTDLPNLRGSGVVYSNNHYTNGYTDQGQIMGSWIGREGRGVQATSKYWISPRRTVNVYYRNERVNPDFLGGGLLYDVGAQADMTFRQVTVSPNLQYEHWRFPLLNPSGPQSNMSISLQLTYQPHWKKTW